MFESAKLVYMKAVSEVSRVLKIGGIFLANYSEQAIHTLAVNPSAGRLWDQYVMGDSAYTTHELEVVCSELSLVGLCNTQLSLRDDGCARWLEVSATKLATLHPPTIISGSIVR